MFLGKFEHESARAIVGHVIEEYHMKVRVVLLKNRVDVFYVPVACHVVVTGNHDTERLLWIS